MPRRLVNALALMLTAALLLTAVCPAVAAAMTEVAGGGGVTVWFGTRGEWPSLVEVQLFTPQDDHPLTTAINGLIAGAPAGSPLLGLLPAATRLNGASVDSGIATLDFSPDLLAANVGSLGEAMLIASVANTAAQFPTVEQVRFLVAGQPVETIAGHILASEPLGPDYRFQPPGFADTARSWAEPQICAMILRGVINGYPDRTFRPERAVTRAEIIKLITAAAGGIDWSPGTQSFTDVTPAHPLYAYVENAVKRGVILPADYARSDGTVRLAPDGACTRREAATMLARAAGRASRADELRGQPLPWSDTMDQPAWAAGFLLAVAESGLMEGYPDLTFRPAGTLTRAEAATVVARLIGCAPGSEIAPAISAGEASGAPGALVAGSCRAGVSLRLDISAADGTVLASHPLAPRQMTSGCAYFAALLPAAQLPAQAASAEVLALAGTQVLERWSASIAPR